MNRTLALAALMLASATYAQNLVPNPSFEEYTTCPDFYGQWFKCVDWTSPPMEHSADYFNTCDSAGLAGVPRSAMGYQPAQDGGAYMGVITYVTNDSTYREYIAAQLNTPLVQGTPVRLCFHASTGGFGSDPSNSAHYSSKGIGLRFFMSSPYTNYHELPYPNAAALYLHQVLDDTSAWTTVSGIYVPDSAYEWLAIGNFFNDSLSAAEPLDILSSGANWAYAFIDNVSVSYDLGYCGHVTGMEDSRALLAHVQNPFVDRLRIVLAVEPSELVDLKLYDAMGKEALGQQSPPGAQVIDLPTGQLASGHYMLTGRVGSRPITPAHVVHFSP